MGFTFKKYLIWTIIYIALSFLFQFSEEKDITKEFVTSLFLKLLLILGVIFLTDLIIIKWLSRRRKASYEPNN